MSVYVGTTIFGQRVVMTPIRQSGPEQRRGDRIVVPFSQEIAVFDHVIPGPENQAGEAAPARCDSCNRVS